MKLKSTRTLRTPRTLALAGLVALSLIGLDASATAAPQQGRAASLPGVGSTDPIIDAPIIACFAEGTDPEYVQIVNDMIAAMNRGDYQLGTRWSGVQGSPRALTWSFVPDGLNIPNGIGEPAAPSNLFATLDASYAGQGGRATWVNRFVQVFNRWAQISGLSYTRVTTGGNDWDDGAVWGSAGSAGLRGDIRISMKPIDGGNNVLAYNNFPSNGDMVIDSAEGWSSTSNQNRFFRNVIAHEHGHGIGLQHVCPANGTKLMEPFLSTSFDGPRHDDFRAAQRHYGDNFEDDNTSGTASFAGTVNQGSPLNAICAIPAPVAGGNPANTSICSIDANGEQDYFRIGVAQPGQLTVTVTPLGLTYSDNAQGGTCPSTNSTNSLSQANLSIDLIAANGVTVLATAAANGVGLAETISNFAVAANDHYVRVYEADAPTQTQLYNLVVTLSASCAGGTPDCNGNGQLDTCDISNEISQDCNGNSVPDECDTPDPDNDDVPDDCDICQSVYNPAQSDVDFDGLGDECDNCPLVDNGTQEDADFDGLGNACDNCVALANPGQDDCDFDGIGDVCEIAGGAPDCNANDVPDSCDIAGGSSTDTNSNSIPDECEGPGTGYCFGDNIDPIVTADCPCSNFGAAGSGCANSFSSLGGLLTASGTTTPNTIVFLAQQIPNNTLTVGFRNTDNMTPGGVQFGDGVRCQTGTLIRFGAHNSGTSGDSANTWSSTTTAVGAGLTRYYQIQYRNSSPAFCPPETFNITNGYRITW